MKTSMNAPNLKQKLFFVLLLSTLPRIVFLQTSEQVSINDLSEWYAYTNETGKVEDAANIFATENNVIKLQGKIPGYIATKNSYTNYKLAFDFCWETDTVIIGKAKKRNSGVIYHVPVDWEDGLWPKGIQFQIKEGFTGDFILMNNTTIMVNDSTYGPGRSVIIPKSANAEKETGTWNHLELITKNGKCKQFVNGDLVNEGIKASETKGRIVIMFEGFPLKFRNIEITTFN